MPKVLTLDEQEKKADQEELKLQARRNKAKRTKLNVILDENPELLQPILELAQRLADSKTAAGSDKPVAVKHDQAEEGPKGLARVLTRNDQRIESLHIQDLKLILFSLNSIRFTPHALKSLLQKGQKEVSKVRLGEIIEYLTGMDLKTEVGHQFFRTLEQFADHSKELMKCLPGGADRATMLPLPPYWPTDGSYAKLGVSADYVEMKLRHGSTVVKVLNGQMGFRWSGDGSALEVRDNFSDSKACLVCKGNAQPPLMLHSLFQSQPPSEHLAITDGSTPGVATPARTELTPEKSVMCKAEEPDGGDVPALRRALSKALQAKSRGKSKKDAMCSGSNASARTDSAPCKKARKEPACSSSPNIKSMFAKSAAVDTDRVDEATFCPPVPDAP